MHCKLQLVVGKETVLDIASFEKPLTGPETIGLSVSEAKNILQNLQQKIVENQIEKTLEKRAKCFDCQKALGPKDRRTVKYRTLCGTLNIQNPRYYLCPKCHKPHGKKSITPLADLLKDHTAPELSYLEAKWASLMSYGLTVDLLKDSFPIDDNLCVETVRKNTLRISAVWRNSKNGYSPPIPNGLGDFFRHWHAKVCHFIQ